VRFEPGRDFLVWKTLAPASRTVVACIRRCSARQTRGVGYFRLGRACPRCAPKSARGRRSQRCVRSTSALRNRSYSSTRASSFPSAVTRGDALRRRVVTLFPAPFGSVLVGAIVLGSRRRLARPKTSGVGIGKLGAARCERGWGESRFTTRFSLRRPDDLVGGVFFRLTGPRIDRLWHPCRLLRPSSPRSHFFERGIWSGGRRDRFHERLVKGVRFDDRGCLPPAVLSRSPPAPKLGRTRVAPFEERRSRDEDRRSVEEPPSFCSRRARALARPNEVVSQAPVHALLCDRAGFRPGRRRWRASLSPRAYYQFLQYDDARALTAGLPRSSFCKKRGRTSSRLHLRPPPRGGEPG
jgi:hypothetical protein